MPETTTWHPSRLFSTRTPTPSTSTESRSPPYALIILNQPINTPALTRLLPKAKYLICADAGGDRYKDYFEDLKPGDGRVPDAIVGDLDSISDDGLEFWRSRNVHIHHVEDQYSTDLKKSLVYLSDLGRNGNEPLDIIVFGSLGGRVDQGFSLVHHLVLARSPELCQGSLYLVSEVSLSFVLERGKNLVFVHDWNVASGSGMGDDDVDANAGASQGEVCSFRESVGIIPLTGSSVISTSGFEWDVTDWKTELGGQVSTSNHIRSGRMSVDVQGSNICLFTMELAEHLQLGYRDKDR